MALKGSRELRARLRAIRQVFKPIGREWADATVIEAKRRIVSYQDTGKTYRSIRRTNASMKKARVGGFYPVNFIDAGTKAHDITPKRMSTLKFQSRSGQTVFAKKVHKPRQAARPFKRASGLAGLEKVPFAKRVIELWNRAA